MIGVRLPAQLRTLARTEGEVLLRVEGPLSAEPFIIIGAVAGG